MLKSINDRSLISLIYAAGDDSERYDGTTEAFATVRLDNGKEGKEKKSDEGNLEN